MRKPSTTRNPIVERLEWALHETGLTYHDVSIEFGWTLGEIDQLLSRRLVLDDDERERLGGFLGSTNANTLVRFPRHSATDAVLDALAMTHGMTWNESNDTVPRAIRESLTKDERKGFGPINTRVTVKSWCTAYAAAITSGRARITDEVVVALARAVGVEVEMMSWSRMRRCAHAAVRRAENEVAYYEELLSNVRRDLDDARVEFVKTSQGVAR